MLATKFKFLTPSELVREVVRIWPGKDEALKYFEPISGQFRSVKIRESALLIRGESRPWLMSFGENIGGEGSSQIPWLCYIAGTPIRECNVKEDKKPFIERIFPRKEIVSPLEKYFLDKSLIEESLGNGKLYPNALVVVDHSNRLDIVDERFDRRAYSTFDLKKRVNSKDMMFNSQSQTEDSGDYFVSELINPLSALLLSVLRQ